MPVVQALFQRATTDTGGFTTAQNVAGSFLSFNTLSDALAFTSGALANTDIHPDGVVAANTPKGGAGFFYSGQLIFISSSREFYEARFTEAEALGANNPPNDSASLHLVEFPVSLINTSSLIAPHQTSSFVLNSQTSSFVTNSQTSSFVTNSQTSSFVTNSQTSSFVTNSQTSSFVTNSQTGSFVTNAQTSSFVVNSQTSSFVTNAQTSSFVVNSQTGSFVVNSQTSSFVTNAQTSSFITDSIFTTFTSSFTDKSTDGSQVRITIDAIPSESIFNMREISSGSFGTKASGSITVGTGFGTNANDTLYLDLDTGFVLTIRNFTGATGFNGSDSDGATLNAASTTDFLLTASSFINDNDSFGITRNKAFTCDKVAGILSSSVNGSTLALTRKTNGTFGNDFKVASGSQTLANISGSQTFGFGGGSSYTITEAQSRGDEIANIVVLDISGSSDGNAVLRRMDLLSFLDEAFIAPINDKLDTLLEQYNSANNKTPNPDLDGDGQVAVTDVLEVLSKFGESVSVEALPTPGSSNTAAGTPDGGSSREGLKTAGAVTDQNDSVITNGILTIGNQSSGSLVLEGTEFLTTPAKLDFLDKIGGTPGLSSSGVFTSSGSLFFHSESIGSFEFNRPLSASNLSGTNTGDQDLSSYIQASQTGSFLTSVPAGTLSSSAQIASDISGAFDSVSASLASDIPTVPVSSYTNSGNGRVVTSVNSSTINGEQRLTYSNEGGLSITNGSTGGSTSLTVDSDIVGTDSHIRLTHPDGGAGSGLYLSSSGDLLGTTFKLHFGDIENQGNNTTLIVDDANEKITISKAISASGAITAQSFNGTIDGGSF